jgi:hypothetical protein
MAAEIRFEFIFEGDPWDNPEELSTILGVEATSIGNKDSLIPGRNGQLFIDTFWKHVGIAVMDYNLDDLTDDFLSIFASKAQLIEGYMATHPHLNVTLGIVISTVWDDFPGLFFDDELITFLGRIHASIKCDIDIRDSDSSDKYDN